MEKPSDSFGWQKIGRVGGLGQERTCGEPHHRLLRAMSQAGFVGGTPRAIQAGLEP